MDLLVAGHWVQGRGEPVSVGFTERSPNPTHDTHVALGLENCAHTH
jgi:hypothetical protein